MNQISPPEDETFIAEGVISHATPGGGGYSHAPTFTTLVVGNSTVTIRFTTNCIDCDIHGRRGGGSYGPGTYVLITQIHGHYVVRTQN